MRATARLIGVDEGTIRNDLRRPAENSAPAPEIDNELNEPNPAGAENSALSPAWFQGEDVNPAKLAKKEETRKGAGERREARLADISAGKTDRNL